MGRRVVELGLVLVTVVGAVLAWQTGRERSRLQGIYDRLRQKTGELAVGDTTRLQVRAIETGEPLSFAWRVYMPANFQQNLRYGTRGSSGMSRSWSRGPHEFIARVRFRENDEGKLEIYTRFSGGSSRMDIGDQSLAKLLRGRWNKVRVEQLGAGETAAVEPDRPALFLRLSLREEIQEEAKTALTADEQKLFLPVLYELELGPTAPKP